MGAQNKSNKKFHSLPVNQGDHLCLAIQEIQVARHLLVHQECLDQLDPACQVGLVAQVLQHFQDIQWNLSVQEYQNNLDSRCLLGDLEFRVGQEEVN